MRYRTQIAVRYAETDRMGIAYHSVYPIWYEQARSEFVAALGLPYSQMEEEGVLTPLSALECHFKGSCTYEDRLCVEVWVERLTPARVVFAYQIFKEGEERPINTGSTTHGWTGPDLRPLNLKKRRPDIYQLVLSAMEGEEG